MKIEGYKPSVGLNTINGSVKVSGDKMAYGAGGAGFDVLGNAAGKWAETVATQQAADDDAAVIDATNAANAEIMNYFNGENGLLSRQGINASGSFAEAQDFVRKTQEKYIGKLGNSRRANEFRAKFNPNAFNYLRTAGTHERKERYKADEVRFNTAIDNSISGMLMNYNDVESTDNLIRDMSGLVDFRGMQMGWDSDTILLKKKELITKGLDDAINDAIGKDDYVGAENLLNRYQSIMMPSSYMKLNNKLTDIRLNREYYRLMYDYVDQCKDETGIVDITKLDKIIDDNWGPSNNIVEGILPYRLPISQGDNPDLEHLDKNLRGSIDLVGGVLHQMGLSDNAVITSGYRDAERNAQVGGADNSWHTKGNAIDISLGNINADERDRLKKVFSPFFGEVLYHDAGSGVHLHLGNYKNNLTPDSEIDSPFNAKKYKELKQIAYARAQDINAAVKREQAKYKQVIILNATKASHEEAIAMINNSNLSLKEKADLIAEQNKLRDPKTFKKMTSEDKHWYNYLHSGNYERDVNLMAEYDRRAQDSMDIISDKEQQHYNKAARNLNMYYAYVNPNYQTKDYNQDYSLREGYDDILEAMEAMAEAGLSKQEISDRIRAVVPKYGMDPEYYIKNAPWDKLGPEGVE